MGSSAEAAIQIITPKLTMHNAALIHRSSLNIGLMVMLGEFVDLAISRPVLVGVVTNRTCGQIDLRRREWVSERGPRNGEHGLQITPWSVVKHRRHHCGLRLAR